MATSGKKSLFLVAVAILILLIAAAGTAFSLRKEKPIAVQWEKVSRRNLTELVIATGRIQPVKQVVINPEVSGEIVDLPVEEGQTVIKGDLLLRIRPDNYVAARASSQASYESSLASMDLSKANLDKAQIELKRAKELHQTRLMSDSEFLQFENAAEVAAASHKIAIRAVEQAKAALARAEEELSRTVIYSPMSGTVVNLKSELGERVVGTGLMAGTEIMTVAHLEKMEARVDVGEIDIVLIKQGQKAQLQVDAFRKERFAGVVTEIANAAKTSAPGTQQETTKFQVKIRLLESARLRPGLSATAYIETRYRTNVLAVPIQSVTVRLPQGAKAQNTASMESTSAEPRPAMNSEKLQEVVFLAEDSRARMAPVRRGISDDQFIEIEEGLAEGAQVIVGNFQAINRELNDGAVIAPEDSQKSLP